ncbi:MAG: glutamine--fructose-6-phosphate transaminase (isomerizing) [Deltaproteobacteria bacterium]|nr:glutamine--fructose-6-phosphate transaminase (isomerizing) [Deltaproteobacteria bacterium]
MCGIVGYIGFQNATPILVDGLKSLEYRGYDSSGVAVLNQNTIQVVRSEGKIIHLEDKLQKSVIEGCIGIGHTRWATHGKPVEKNAHPHIAHNTVLVHNGIIENYEELREQLRSEGVQFSSDTDTEVIPWLIDKYLEKEGDIEKALYKAISQLKGAFALALFSKSDPSTIYVAKNASPLIIGVGQNETFLSSDIPALLNHTKEVVILDDGQVAKLRADQIVITDFQQHVLDVTPRTITWSKEAAQKGGYDHFMLKEIHEQPSSIADCLRGRINDIAAEVDLSELSDPAFFDGVDTISILACGSSYHAALVGQYWLEKFVHIPVSVEIASEYRYRNPYMYPNTLSIAITQSGETADTLAAFSLAKSKGAKTLSICNVVDSSIARMGDEVLYTHAGPEIGVASTKAFTTQLVLLALVTLHMAKKNKTMAQEDIKKLTHDLLELPRTIEETLHMNEDIENICKQFTKARDFLYLGRGASYPIALEGALKLKEISYIHAEGYMGGELKHGPLALIDDEMPILALSQRGVLNEKMKSNVEEVNARGGQMITLSEEGDDTYAKISDVEIKIPHVHELILPIIQTIPLQLFSYYIAKRKGCDVDQPRNLAKSVTVE